ncbi:MAG: MFS transporter [Bdellovibrio sp.]
MALLSALKHKNFTKLYIAGLTSELGSFLTETALTLLLFDLSQKNTALLGIMRALFLVSMTAGNILGGPLGEKYNRKNILIATEIFRIPAIILLFFIQTPISIILCITFIAFFTGVFRPTRQTLVNDVVPPAAMRNANSLFASTFAIMHITGPFFGALLYSTYNGVNEVLIFDFATYILGIYLLRKITWKAPVKHQKMSLKKDFQEGLSYVSKRLDVRAILINNCIAGFNIGILISLLIPHTTETLGWSKSMYGVLMAAFGFGGLIGGTLASTNIIKIHLGKLIILLLFLESIFFIGFNFSDWFLLTTTLFFIWGVSVFLRVSNQLNFFSTTVETQYLNRVMSLSEMSFITPNILGSAIVGALGNLYSTTTLLSIASASFFIALVVRMFMKDTQVLKEASLEQVQREAFIENSIGL